MSVSKLLIFDLDGTINDSSPGIVYSFKKTAEILGKNEIDEEHIVKHGLSGPFEKNIAEIFDLNQDTIMDAIKVFIEIYAETGQGMSKLFPGIEDALISLKKSGYKLCIATMMGEDFAKETLKGYGIDNLFISIRGTDLTTVRSKSDLIDRCLYDAGADKKDTVMIGDGMDDYNCSKDCGIGFIGITYGYDIKEEFCKERKLPYANDPTEIRKAVEEYFNRLIQTSFDDAES